LHQLDQTIITQAAPTIRLPEILIVCPDPKMIWPHAGWPITSVTDELACRDEALAEFVANAMSAPAPRADAVALIVASTAPQPTSPSRFLHF
jgi:hypothetical protein